MNNQESDIPVYEIDLSKKYILSFRGVLSLEDREKIRQKIKEWMEGDDPFLLIMDGVKLLKIETPEEDKKE